MAIECALMGDTIRVAVRGTSGLVAGASIFSCWKCTLEENCRCGNVVLTVRSIGMVTIHYLINQTLRFFMR